MLRLQNLKFERGQDVLFSGLDLIVYPGTTHAIVGRNGVGKSTLFNLILGRLEPSTGEIDMPAAWRIGYMAQEVASNDRPAIDYVIDGHSELRRVEEQIATTQDDQQLASLWAEYQDLGGYEAKAKAGSILYGLGFDGKEIEQPYRSFSGGWRIRLNLAQALMTPSDLLLLDEPTNHLDLEAILWLEGWLSQFQGALLIIAHDREFLDATADNVLHLAGTQARSYQGNYTAFERLRREELALEHAVAAKQKAQAQHIQSFVDRFRAKASKAKQVQSRIKALERMQEHAALHVDSEYRVQFSNPDKVSNPLISFRDLQLGYNDQQVLGHISQTILPGARIGVLGANGAGKSTLLKAIVGDLDPMAGELSRGTHSSIGYFAQHQLEALNTSDTAFEAMQRFRGDFSEQHIRDYLGGWGFSLPMTMRPIKSLSGGEKARFVLAMLAADQPAMLVMDEPTNHLDLDMRDALALALQAYSGAVIVVAHDRSLLEKIVDELWLVEAGGLCLYSGDLEDYTAAKKGSPDGTNASGSVAKKKNQRQERAAARASVANLRSEVKHLDKKMAAAADELLAVETVLADKNTYDTLPADELKTLMSKAHKLRRQLEETEERWLLASEQLENSV